MRGTPRAFARVPCVSVVAHSSRVSGAPSEGHETETRGANRLWYWHDDSYDRTLFPPGSNCQGNPGTECTYFEILASDFTQLFSPLNSANLPMAKHHDGTCKPVFPHEFIKVNTAFEVIHAAGAIPRGLTSTKPTTS